MGSRLSVVLIRHGITAYNLEKRYLGHLDLPLLLEGKSQLKLIKPNCSNLQLDRVFSSDLSRCVETASYLFPSAAIRQESMLREYDFGDWEGKRYKDLMDHEFYRSWIDDPITYTPPNAESFQCFSRRVIAGFWSCLQSAEKHSESTVVIVTHGGVIRQILTHFAPSQKSFFDWEVNMGSIYQLSGEINELRRGKRFNSLQVEHITEKTNG